MFTRKIYTSLTCLLFTSVATAQSDNIMLSDKQNRLMERLDAKFKNLPLLRFNTVKPLNRANITKQAEYIDSLDKAGAIPGMLTNVDRSDLRDLFMNNSDQTTNYQDSFASKKPIFKTFFKTQAHLLAFKGEDYNFIVDPLLNFQFGHSSDGSKLFINSRGVRIRGNIDNFSFYTRISDNQERDPLYAREYVGKYRGLPDNAYYKDFKDHPGAYDYFNIRGGVGYTLNSNLKLEFAYDQFFIGQGFRSLFMSNFSAPMTYLRANYHKGKFNYNAVLAQTVATNNRYVYAPNGDSTLPRNYMLFHHLSYQANEWLQLGAFENSIYNTNGAQRSTLPTSYRYDADVKKGIRSTIGLDFKAIPLNDVVLYGQWVSTGNPLKTFSDSKSNKTGYQLGAKYMDAFTIPNLDLQFEYNSVRPFTYSDHYNVNNYAQYNLPLAHPLGANFREMVGVISYHPFSRFYFNAKGFYVKQGLNSADVNYGGNIFIPDGYKVLSIPDNLKTTDGVLSKTLYGNFTGSFELVQNLFFDANYTIRNQKIEGVKNDVHFYTFGLRWNLPHRDFDF